ncbi:hypothetical protein [Streptomyces fulvorobeus]|uniref:Uncharacterized protein n=1 Tax=Streptomyces fulvorobeus TaxID=284028 RepID=A0A7J0C4Z8_9ACTN|nr:hypothetical protein [Streptomyces fulvorobeus]NYE41270.1 hypothetical protein [Streptomyces fulvorobeus]GFM97615.1 hypothetical protein Sfulv_24260 [Streptomyces fulvorobeus]
MKRSSSHRLVAHGRTVAAGCVVLLMLVAGVWSSWDTAHHVVLSKGREHGTMTVTGCDGTTCTGSYVPDRDSPPRPRVTITKSVAVQKGDRFPVVVKPDTGEVVRTGTPGFLHAWVPFGGALLLSALVIGGGLRMSRLAWGAAAAGAVLLTATFIAL